MNPTELANLIVRLTGDATSYVSMLAQAQVSTERMANEAQAGIKKIEGLENALKSVARTAISALGSLGLASTLSGAFDKFIAAERSTIRLTAAIESNGAAVSDVLPKYKSFIDQMTSVTLMTAGGTKRLLEQAETMGFSGEQAIQVATNAIALAKGNDELAQSYIRVATMIQRGHPEFARRILGLQGVKDKTELLDKIQQRLVSNMNVATKEAMSVGGSIDRLKRSIVDLNVEIGKIVAQVVGPVISVILELVKRFKALDDSTKQTIVRVLLATMAFLALAPAISAISYFIGPLISLLSALASAIVFAATSPVTLFLAGIAAMVAAIVYFTGFGATLIPWFSEQWSGLVDDVKTSIDGIVAAIKAGDIELAWKIVWAQIQLTWAKSTIDLQKMWIAFTFSLAEALVNAERWITSSWEKMTNSLAQLGVDAMESLGILTTKQAADISKMATDKMEANLKAIEAARKALLGNMQDASFQEIQDLDKELKKLTNERDKLVKEAKDKPPIKIPDFVIPPLPKIPDISVKIVPKFDAAAFASAEAISRIAAWRDQLDMQLNAKTGEERGGLKQFDAAAAGSAEANTRQSDANTILKDIRDILKGQSGDKVIIFPAGV